MSTVINSTNKSGSLQVVVPMPAAVQRVSCSYPAEPQPRGSQAWDWQEKQRRLVWKLNKLAGGTEHTLQVRGTYFETSSQHDICILRSGVWCLAPAVLPVLHANPRAAVSLQQY